MSTTLWLCNHDWRETCADCDFDYSCVWSQADGKPDDCDEFCHSGYEREDDAE